MSDRQVIAFGFQGCLCHEEYSIAVAIAFIANCFAAQAADLPMPPPYPAPIVPPDTLRLQQRGLPDSIRATNYERSTPRIEMNIGDWYHDEFGNQSREIKARD